MNKRYKLYLASGIRLWTMSFKDQYSGYFNKKVDLFQPALIDNQFAQDHRLIPIRIATKDLGEINKSDAVLAYMKMYDTQNNGPAGTDSTWECGYAIGGEKPTIMLVEDLEHLDYYSAQWMVTFSIGAILTTSKEVAEFAKNNDKFTHTTILYCLNKDEFENKIIGYLDTYYKSIYAREGIINHSVDNELRIYGDKRNVLEILNASVNEPANNQQVNSYLKPLDDLFKKLFVNKKGFDNNETYKEISQLELEKSKVVKKIISTDYESLVAFLHLYIKKCLNEFEKTKDIETISEMIEYWLSIPAKEVSDRKQGKKKTRPTILFELYDLVSHHIVYSQRYYGKEFVYKAGAIVEIYNWLNTYAIDDVFDNSDTRQGEKTLHIKYKSRKNAILLGSIGHCFALILLQRLTNDKPEIAKKLLSSLNDVQLMMYLGQPVDIELTFKNKKQIIAFIKKNNLKSVLTLYFSRIYGICGAFYEEIGRMAMQATNVSAQFYNNQEVEDACIYIAKLFGLVQMIRNDLGDFIFPEQMSKMGKGLKNTSHNDIAEGKMTLPVLYAIFNTHTNPKDKNILIKHLGNRKLSAKEKIEISRIIWESGAIEYCMQFVDYYCRQVREEYVQYIHETPTRLKWIIKLMDITSLINLSFRELAIQNQWRKLEPQVVDTAVIDNLEKITNRQNYLKNAGLL
jgi:geranylgeranyl pyrophosphate synthase/nucleoside 2-deoxyribosyltransferase